MSGWRAVIRVRVNPSGEGVGFVRRRANTIVAACTSATHDKSEGTRQMSSQSKSVSRQKTEKNSHSLPVNPPERTLKANRAACVSWNVLKLRVSLLCQSILPSLGPLCSGETNVPRGWLRRNPRPGATMLQCVAPSNCRLAAFFYQFPSRNIISAPLRCKGRIGGWFSR